MAIRSSSAKTSPAGKSPVKKPAAKVTLRQKLSGLNSSAKGSPDIRESDIPMLPIDQLERLHAIKPDAVDWVIQQTQIEAEHRREETSRVNSFILIEHIFGQLSALLLGAAGILGGSWVVTNGQTWAGLTIVIVVVSALTLVYLRGRSKQ